MPEILVRKDNLDDVNRRFQQAAIAKPVFLNSIPKSGSHLLRNIMRMFVPVDASGPAVLAKLFDRWPVERIGEREAA